MTNCPQCGKPEAVSCIHKDWYICLACQMNYEQNEQGIAAYMKTMPGRYGSNSMEIIVPYGTLPVFKEEPNELPTMR